MPKAPKIRSSLDRLREYAHSLGPQVGFFSTLDELVQQAPFEKGTPEQWRGYLQPGRMLRRDELQFPLRKEELAYALERAFKHQQTAVGDEQFARMPMSKEEVLSLIRAVRPQFGLNVGRVGTSTKSYPWESAVSLGTERTDPIEMRRAIVDFDEEMGGAHMSAGRYYPVGAKYGPDRQETRRLSHVTPGSTYEESVTRLANLKNQRQHFTEDALSWGRTSSHELPSGERMRLIEEIQSDLHQRAARRVGDAEDFLDENELSELREINNERDQLMAEIDENNEKLRNRAARGEEALADQLKSRATEVTGRVIELDARRRELLNLGDSRRPRRGYLNEDGTVRDTTAMGRRDYQTPVPDAPFKDPADYAMLELRKQLLNAANNDEDYLALIDAQSQYERYGMDDDSDPDTGGMDYFYDTLYPSVLKKLANRYGATIENVRLPTAQKAVDIRPEDGIMRDVDAETMDDFIEGALDSSDDPENMVGDIVQSLIDIDPYYAVVPNPETGGTMPRYSPTVKTAVDIAIKLQEMLDSHNAQREAFTSISPETSASWRRQERELIGTLKLAARKAWSDWEGHVRRESPEIFEETGGKEFPALRLTPEVRERIKRIGVPLFSIAGGNVMFNDETEGSEYQMGGEVKKPDVKAQRRRSGLDYLHAIGESLANSVPFLSDDNRAELTTRINRPLAGIVSQWSGIDNKGQMRAAGPYRDWDAPQSEWEYNSEAQMLLPPERSVTPGLVTETLALPADFRDMYSLAKGAITGNPPEELSAPAISRRAQEDTTALREQLMSGMQLDEPHGFTEHALESAGIMAGQIPVGELPAIATRVPKVLKALSWPVRAGMEWFSPIINPKMGNYVTGTLFGGALGFGAEKAMEKLQARMAEGIDPEAAIAEGVRSGEITEEEGEALLQQLFGDQSAYTTGGGFAKGGSIKRGLQRMRYPPHWTEKQKRTVRAHRKGESVYIADLPPDYEARSSFEGDLIDVTDHTEEEILDLINDTSKPPTKHAKGGNVKPPRLAVREKLAQLIREAELKEAGVQGTGQELVPVDRPLTLPEGTPAPPDPIGALEKLKVSRRDVLEGMAGAMSPIKLDPLSLLKASEEDIQGNYETMIQREMEQRMPPVPQMGVLARINDGEGYERVAWGLTPSAANRSLFNQLLENGEAEDIDQALGIFNKFGVNYTKGTDQIRDQLEDPFEDLMQWFRGHGLTPEILDEAEADVGNEEALTGMARQDRFINKQLEAYAEANDKSVEEVREMVKKQLRDEIDNELFWEPEDPSHMTPDSKKALEELSDDGLILDMIHKRLSTNEVVGEIQRRYPDLTPAEALDVFIYLPVE